MLEQIDFSAPHTDKHAAKEERDKLTDELVLLQQRAVTAKVPLVLVFEGWEDAGKGSRINELITNLDARATEVHVTGDPVGYESRLPFMARFWSKLGPRGHITIFDQSWYYAAALDAVTTLTQLVGTNKKLKKRFESGDFELTKVSEVVSEVTTRLDSIDVFERQLHDNGYVVVKIFLHISKKEQAKRIEHLLKDPATAWHVDAADYHQQKYYKQYQQAMDLMLTRTNKSYAPWFVLNAEDKAGTRLGILRAIVSKLKPAVEAAEAKAASEAAAQEEVPALQEEPAAVPDAFKPYGSVVTGIDNGFDQQPGAEEPRERDGLEAALLDEESDKAQDEESSEELEEQARNVGLVGGASADDVVSRFHLVQVPTLADVDHTLSLTEEEYRTRLKEVQERLSNLHQRIYLAKIPVMVAYEGWDAAGKGGNIKRLAQALDARGYHIYPSPAPTPNELAHPHLWRYWTRLPRTGHIGIYDRTWYGRVLVERVENLAAPEEWRRGYDEINEFEEDMRRAGVLLVKFWIDVSPEEQLRRFEARQNDPTKQWKIVPDDWRNRGKNPQYYVAINDMLRLTSTEYAPWHIIESDDKRYARVKALTIVADAMEERLREVEE